MKKGKIWALAALCASVVLSAGTAAACSHKHEFGAWSITTAPTENGGGTATRECKDGDEKDGGRNLGQGHIDQALHNCKIRKVICLKRGGEMRKNLKEARRAAGMTQKAVAEYLNVSERHYKFMESGQTTGNVELWDKLEDLFKIHQRVLREIHLDKEGNP